MVDLLLAQSAFPEAMGQGVLTHYLFVSAAMFTLGLVGFLTRRNLIIMNAVVALATRAGQMAPSIAPSRPNVMMASAVWPWNSSGTRFQAASA